MKKVVSTLALLFLTLGLSACARKSEHPPIVKELKQYTVPVTGASAKASAQPAVVTEVTLRKSSILGRSFLFGASLQFSSINQEDIQTSLMGIALGQTPAEFRIVDDHLRLETDGRVNFESDVNHPSRLAYEFAILRQDAETVTIKAERASPLLDTFLFGDKNKVATRAAWIRSLEFKEADELFLIESSIELTDGSIAEFMETLTPRDRVVPADAKPLLDDADRNPLAKRFRFLEGPKAYMDIDGERVQSTAAQRFLLRNEQPILWYVTANVPEAYFNDVKNGIEGWNRYARAMWNRDIVRFEGRLPEGVKIGDPRYNIVIWDNIQEAGAAYESQGSDPLTGVQTHSLIYLPLAWVNIGKEYWKNAARTEAEAEARLARVASLLKNRQFLGRPVPVNCVDSAHLHVNLKSKESPEEFARALLKNVLFHEVGHALGLAHNFKGSLSFDPDQANPVFSTSIMDYNHYNQEGAAFSTLEGAEGPLLEYDRQILSVLYNDGKDVKETDPTLPACDDEEADSKADGVDPLCVRYDIGKDTTAQAVRAIDLLRDKEAHSGQMTSLPKALARVVRELPDASTIDTVEKAKAALGALTNSVRGTTNIYVGGSANSLAYLGSQALKSLFVFRPDVLPEGYDEQQMRERALTVLETVSSSSVLPEASRTALAEVRDGALSWLATTAAFQGQDENQRNTILTELRTSLEKANTATENAVLSAARRRFVGALPYSSTAPLSFHKRDTAELDLEQVVVRLLEQTAGPRIGDIDRPAAERLAAITSLITYAKTGAGREAIERVKQNLQAEINGARDARKREELRKLFGLLS